MRSLKYVPAVLSASFLNVLAKGNFDATVVVTTTRTVTFCPIANLFDCAAPEPTEHWGDWSQTVTPTTAGTTTTTRSNAATTTSSSGNGPSTRTTSSTSGNGQGTGSTTSTSGRGTSSTLTTTSGNGQGTTSTISTSGNGHGTGSTTSTSGTGSTTSIITSTTSRENGVNGTTTTAGTETTTSGVTTTTSRLDGVNGTTTTTGTGTTTTTSGTESTTSTTVTTSHFEGNGTTTTSFTSTTTPIFEGNGTTTTSLTSTTSHLDSNGTTTSSLTSTMTTTTAPFDGNGTTTTSFTSTMTTTTPPFGGNGTTTTSNFGGNGTTTTTPFGGNVTTTTPITSMTTPFGNVTTTPFNNGTTTTPTTTANTTTSTTCGNATSPHTASPTLAEPLCNSPEDRSTWCGGRSVADDTHSHLLFAGPVKRFTLVLTVSSFDFDGTPQSSYAINGKSPGEAIEVNWGDRVEITVVNNMNIATSIHWHGVRQEGTNDQDGVPGVTECPLAPGSTRLYSWTATTYGTGWYHSHLASQYGGGIRGPIIIHGPASANYDLDMGAIMINEKFASTIDIVAATAAKTPGGLAPSTNYLLNGKNLSPNGQAGESAKWIVKSGKKHLFRIINSSAQSGYAVHFDGHKMKVISADFTPIVPYETEWLYIQSGQRYNVIVEMNQKAGAYYLRAVTQTGCGTSSGNNGMSTSNGVFEYEGSCDKPTPGNLTFNANVCQDEPIASLVPVVPRGAGDLAKFTATSKLLPAGNAGTQAFSNVSIVRWFMGPVDDLSTNSATKKGNKTIMVDFDLPTLRAMSTLPNEGFNSSIYSNAVVLDGPANDWVYFVIQNNFQTSHPMHLHGHDVSVVGQGHGIFTADMASTLNFGNPIRRDTVLLWGAPVINPDTGRPFTGPNAPAQSGWTVIGFQTDNPGAWVMHCHIMFHADGGMGMQFIERPRDIKDYYDSQFQNTCSQYEAWEASGGIGKLEYESGLKRRYQDHLEAHKFSGYSHSNVVRNF
ncbi:hypothetical protein LTR64_006969 [Lithohypha guttulata]|uniref:uncharacterized protein n=1 Tax=Lithohypha guttulata TaxID=1690604 RepID=UPI002DE0DD7F|nr:hypothetical protein LTR51_004473 [Lithohypha guttulata]